MTNELCPTCEKGTLIMKNARGSKFNYRALRDIPLELDLEMPTCDQCGEQIVRGNYCKLIDLALERTIYRRALEGIYNKCSCDTPEVCFDLASAALASTAPKVTDK